MGTEPRRQRLERWRTRKPRGQVATRSEGKSGIPTEQPGECGRGGLHSSLIAPCLRCRASGCGVRLHRVLSGDVPGIEPTMCHPCEPRRSLGLSRGQARSALAVSQSIPGQHDIVQESEVDLVRICPSGRMLRPRHVSSCPRSTEQRHGHLYASDETGLQPARPQRHRSWRKPARRVDRLGGCVGVSLLGHVRWRSPDCSECLVETHRPGRGLLGPHPSGVADDEQRRENRQERFHVGTSPSRAALGPGLSRSCSTASRCASIAGYLGRRLLSDSLKDYEDGGRAAGCAEGSAAREHCDRRATNFGQVRRRQPVPSFAQTGEMR